MTAAASSLLVVLNVAMLGYFVVLNAVYTTLLVLGWMEGSRYVARRQLADFTDIRQSALTTPISILVPAYNEQPVIVDSVRALLRAEYPLHEVIVVNDGSTDDTLGELIRAYSLVAVRRVPRAGLASAEVVAVYTCPEDDRLVVVDKRNGGKADAINAALNYARYPLFCTVDSDTIIDDDALLRLVRPFQDQPETVACGGVVRIVNGSTVVDGRVVDVRTPRRLLANIQIVEYLRSFLAGRTGWARIGGLLVISGAFGVFRREVVIAAGGYDTATVGEDAELVVRLHRRLPRPGHPVPHPVAGRSGLLDAGARVAVGAGPPARPVASRAARAPLAPPRHVLPAALRRGGLGRDAVLPGIRGPRPGDRGARLRGCRDRARARRG